MTSYPWLEQLNPQQQSVVTHDGGSVLVVAGAGSGKTRTLAYRVAYLVSRGVDPGRILLLTFTRRAAQEMLSRAQTIIKQATCAPLAGIWSGTFHAVANRLLRIYHQNGGLSPDFTIMDQGDAEDCLNMVRQKEGLALKEKRFPRKSTCLAIYSRRVSSRDSLETVLERYYPWCDRWKDELKRLFKAYVAYKQSNNVLDYDDLLLYWCHLCADKAAGPSIRQRFDHILVDEYQDTNALQAEILMRMKAPATAIMAVGDDAQSIYSFRAASIRNILDFPQQFPGSTLLKLEHNYRSRSPILTTTNILIAQAKQRYSKELFTTRDGGVPPELVLCKDEEQEDESIIRRVLRHREEGVALRDQAVLFRASSHSSSLELALTRRAIPFRKYGGLRFLEAAHIKDFVALLRILENPSDEVAWMRVLLLLDGVGPATAAAIIDAVKSAQNRVDGFDHTVFPSAAQADIRRLFATIAEAGGMNGPSCTAQLERCKQFYLPVLEKNYDNAEPRVNDIDHLVALSASFTRKQFLTELVLDPPSSTSDFAAPSGARDDDYLVLSTIHSAKGGEWDVIYLIHAVDGCIPSDMSMDSSEDIEEELRLMYVALTRARDMLYIVWPQRLYSRSRGLSDWHSYTQCSRFLTPEVVATLNQTTFEGDTVETPDESVPASGSTSIQDALRDFWD